MNEGKRKTCITAPEPIDTVGGYTVGSSKWPRCFILGAMATNKGGVRLINDFSQQIEIDAFESPSPALLAFIARAERELLPTKLRPMSEVTKADLLELVQRAWRTRIGIHDAGVIAEWASERNIRLPEAG